MKGSKGMVGDPRGSRSLAAHQPCPSDPSEQRKRRMAGAGERFRVLRDSIVPAAGEVEMSSVYGQGLVFAA